MTDATCSRCGDTVTADPRHTRTCGCGRTAVTPTGRQRFTARRLRPMTDPRWRRGG